MTDDNSKALIEAISRHGKAFQYYYRPSRKCFKAGFLYTLGGITAILLTVGGALLWKQILG